MSANRYPGNCVECATRVEAGLGHLVKRQGKPAVLCAGCKTPAEGTVCHPSWRPEDTCPNTAWARPAGVDQCRQHAEDGIRFRAGRSAAADRAITGHARLNHRI